MTSRHRSSTPSDAAVRAVLAAAQAFLVQHAIDSEVVIVVAVSGGPDSMTLLDALRLARSKQRLVVVHVNHGARPDADRDEATVVAFAGSLGLPVVVKRVGVPAARRRGESFEVAARRLRYRALGEAVSEAAPAGAPVAIATGHTADDQVETVLMRLTRGAGLDGLQGIRPVSVRKRLLGVAAPILRPLLTVDRATIEAYCAARSLPVCHDTTNDSPMTFRNRVRRTIVPALKAENPKLAEAVARLTQLLALHHDYLAEQVAAVVSHEPGGPTRSVAWERLRGAHPALQGAIVRWLCGPTDDDAVGSPLSVRHVAAVLDLPPDGATDLPGGWVARRVGRFLRVFRRAARPCLTALAPITLTADGSATPVWTRFGPWRVGVTRDVVADPAMAPMAVGGADAALFWAWARHLGPFTVRTWRHGDRYRQLGAPGSRKLHDLFVDSKTPIADRSSWPVFCVGDDIVWTPGARIAESQRLHAGETGALLLAVRSPDAARESGTGSA